MRRTRGWILVGALAALTFAGIAVADQPSTAVATTATFTATTKSNVSTQTCGAVDFTRGTYTGTASSGESALQGSLTIRVNSWFNTSSHLGVLRAHWKVDAAGPGNTGGKLTAVNKDGTLLGLLEGHAAKGKSIVGSFSGTWDANSGFSSLSIGSSTASNLLIVSTGHCNKGKKP